MHKKRQQHADGAVAHQFAGDAGADRLGAADVEILVEGRVHRFHDALLTNLTVGLKLDLHQHIRLGAEGLDFRTADIETGHLRADGADIGLAGFRLHLEEGAAAKIDADIHAEDEEGCDRNNGEKGRERKAPAPPAHERIFGIVGNNTKQFHYSIRLSCAVVQANIILGLVQRYQ